MHKIIHFGILIVSIFLSGQLMADDLVSLVAKVKPSIVGIGLYDPLGNPRATLKGSGFVVGDGSYVVTNHHVVDEDLDKNRNQQYVVFIGSGSKPETTFAEILKVDDVHDLALLKVSLKLSPMKLASSEPAPDGTQVAFTGFPIGAVLGLYPATHRGIIAAYTPVVIPSAQSRQLDIVSLKRLRNPYFVYQLDATAYPGNSGSALYSTKTGEVVGVINKVFVKQSKESVLSDPSGITYAIPVKYVRDLMKSASAL